ncbi:hypothetical protein [Actinoplanes sp. TFC3]|uniref:hypothetical protein n=1 Tax=Actinoplanes sp. TFC3 TaxID=1710355 RepID=UPI001290688F|nr:hypothetical protein [Actinoplanes sp. TFC3]
MDQVWIEQWRGDVRAGIATMLATFESRFGFAPGEHEVSGPATAAELAGLVELHGDAVPAALLAFYRVVAEVRLPDVSNGYWIHRPPLPGEDPGHPRLLSDGRTVVVFGSDGGGAMFALSGEVVLRLAGGVFPDADYEAEHATEVAVSLQDFLQSLRRELTEFAAP